jgi:hypothetical protein
MVDTGFLNKFEEYFWQTRSQSGGPASLAPVRL